MDDRVWSEASVLADVERIVGTGARLVRDQNATRFDILPLLVATDGAISAFGYDGRRLRPNLVIGGVQELEERDWPGRCLRIGEVVVGLEDLRGRCIMTTFDPDTLAHDRRVLTSIVERFGGKLALNAFVIRRGMIGRGDRVELMTKDRDASGGFHRPCGHRIRALDQPGAQTGSRAALPPSERGTIARSEFLDFLQCSLRRHNVARALRPSSTVL